MQETKSAVVDLSKLPCSIIIIGVGDEDWSCMNELDELDQFGNKGPLLRDFAGRQCVRDIMQFVGYKEAMARGNLAE